MGSEAHNRTAPQVVRQIVANAATEAEAMVMLESVVLGLMLYYRPQPREAGEFMDTMTGRVIERMRA